jgi:hypothetical protein
MMMACRRTEGCKGRMVSAGYPSAPFPDSLSHVPVFEWYRPETNALGLFDEVPEVNDHILRGGLILREKVTE